MYGTDKSNTLSQMVIFSNQYTLRTSPKDVNSNPTPALHMMGAEHHGQVAAARIQLVLDLVRVYLSYKKLG